MATHTSSVVIDRPAADVWNVAGDLAGGGFFSRLFDRVGYWSLRRELDGQVLELKRLVEAT